MEDIFDFNEINDEENIENVEPKTEEETENTKRVVKPTRRVVGKRPTLDVLRLTGPRGLGSLENITKNVVLKGKGHEKEDLAKIISCLYHWTHRLYPKMTFEDCLDKIETLGKKRPTLTYLTKLRLGMMEEYTEKPDEDNHENMIENETQDAFSKLIQSNPKTPVLSEEQKERILKNRMVAQARRAAKMQQLNNEQVSNDIPVSDGN
ncbi:hypothetical protein O3M35_004385 [Rhynocoris fuscipes]|uniref:TIMELESS-interacting protein n=1 Tax=Rhynocoris fuscipes TaxID=488301 RepID=A0AAW1CHA0_9HEMI